MLQEWWQNRSCWQSWWLGNLSWLWSPGMRNSGRNIVCFTLLYSRRRSGMEKMLGSAFMVCSWVEELSWSPPSPRHFVGSLFPCSAPDTNGVILFCRMPPEPSKRGEHIPGCKAAPCSCNLRSPPWCLTRSLLCASCVKHQDIPQELLIYFANSALLCGSQTSNGLWSSKISELNSRSFKNLLYYMKDLTLSTCWVFGSWKADLLQIEFVKLRHPGPGLVNAVVKLGGRKKM